jgi:hypothetical protein
MDSYLLATITNHLLNKMISQIMLININRIATYANHAGYGQTFFHDYKIVNVIQEYISKHVTPCFRKILKFAKIMHVTKIAIGKF